MSKIYSYILKSRRKGRKLFAVLIDPDKFNPDVVREANRNRVDLIFIGGSGLRKEKFHACIRTVRRLSRIPLVIFPGGREQVSEKADALLLLSLISGRNPDYLIGEHIRAARQLRRSRLEILPTGYILVDGGILYSTRRVSKTIPIAIRNTSLAVSTAMAGELLGMKLIYLEAGSGAKSPLKPAMIRAVRRTIRVPLIAGGGIDSARKAQQAWRAGADIVVAGNAIEKDINLLHQIASARP